MSIRVVDSSSGSGTFSAYDSTSHTLAIYNYEMFCEIGYEENETDETGYSMYYRYRISVTGNSYGKTLVYFNKTLRCPDGSNLDIYSPKEYEWTPWIHYGRALYNVNYTACDCFCWVRDLSTGEEVNNRTFVPLRWSEYQPTFEIKFDCLGGLPDIDNISYTWIGQSSGVSLPEEHPSKKGYVFVGWEDITTGEVYYNPPYAMSSYGGMTLYAVWKEREPQDIYIDNGIIYAREFIVEEALNTIEIDNRGNIYASAFINSDSCGIDKGMLYAVDFIEGTPS